MLGDNTTLYFIGYRFINFNITGEFVKPVSLSKAIFHGQTGFNEIKFLQGVSFSEANFEKDADFTEALFQQRNFSAMERGVGRRRWIWWT